MRAVCSINIPVHQQAPLGAYGKIKEIKILT